MLLGKVGAIKGPLEVAVVVVVVVVGVLLDRPPVPGANSSSRCGELERELVLESELD